MHAQLSPGRQAARGSRRPCPWPVRRRGPVRGRPCKADGPPHRSHPTDAVRYVSVDTATQRPTALQGDTWRDREETARLAESSQLAGRFPRVWQVLGSNQRRLSRRFYRPSLLSKADIADQHIRRSGLRPGPPPSAIGPCAPGLGHGQERERPRTGPVGAVLLTVRPASWTLTWHFRMPAHCPRFPCYQCLHPRRRERRDPLMGSISLPVDAVRAALQQHRDAVRGGDGVAATPEFSPHGAAGRSWMIPPRLVWKIRPAGVVPYRLMGLGAARPGRAG